MKLIDKWKTAWRYWSVQAMAMALALQGVWLSLPEAIRLTLPKWVVTAITSVILILGLIGRITQQEPGDGMH